MLSASEVALVDGAVERWVTVKQLIQTQNYKNILKYEDVSKISGLSP
jgi:hypothetical protein